MPISEPVEDPKSSGSPVLSNWCLTFFVFSVSSNYSLVMHHGWDLCRLFVWPLNSNALWSTDLCRFFRHPNIALVQSVLSKSHCSPDCLFGPTMSSSASAITAVNIVVEKDLLLGYMDAVRPPKRMRAMLDTEPDLLRSLYEWVILWMM